jgi:type II secretion system protein I
MNLTRAVNHSRPGRAFTLIEVMVAMGIFFMAIFAILSLVSQNIRNSRAVQQPRIDASMVLAQLSLTNQLADGMSDSGDFGDLEAYRGYKWSIAVTEIVTNGSGLFQIDCVVTSPRGGPETDVHSSTYMWRPNSVANLNPRIR